MLSLPAVSLLLSPAASAPRLRTIQPQVMRFLGRWATATFPMVAAVSLARYIAFMFTLALAAAPILAQTPKPDIHSEGFGFSYQLPPDWQVAPDQSALPAAKQNAEQSAKKPGQVLSVACAQVVLSAQHGKPPSVVVVAALPFACYGQAMNAKDLPHFATGISEGLKQNFDVSNVVYGNYKLGTHNFWIERAVGIPKSATGPAYTLEIACTVLKKSAVCWMTLANSAGSLRDFEHGLVTLDGEPPLVLVPIDAFVKPQP
ncbi:MAG TPA: hypothetical protein VGR47_15675 [Terracidiphilus sp.]|nr:hypothetical protein [Terracidiphilus sp.]